VSVSGSVLTSDQRKKLLATIANRE
jgi:hypothetical protein